MAAEPTITDPTARAFDDQGHLDVAGWNTLIVAVDCAAPGETRARFEVGLAQPLEVMTTGTASR